MMSNSVVYGWGRRPLYASSDRVWRLDEALLNPNRLVATAILDEDDHRRPGLRNIRLDGAGRGCDVCWVSQRHSARPPRQSCRVGDTGRRRLRPSARARRARMGGGWACGRFGRGALTRGRPASTASCFSPSLRRLSCRSSSWPSSLARFSPPSCSPALKSHAVRTAAVAEPVIEEYLALQKRYRRRTGARR